jgi:hypothetical protein
MSTPPANPRETDKLIAISLATVDIFALARRARSRQLTLRGLPGWSNGWRLAKPH